MLLTRWPRFLVPFAQVKRPGNPPHNPAVVAKGWRRSLDRRTVQRPAAKPISRSIYRPEPWEAPQGGQAGEYSSTTCLPCGWHRPRSGSGASWLEATRDAAGCRAPARRVPRFGDVPTGRRKLSTLPLIQEVVAGAIRESPVLLRVVGITSAGKYGRHRSAGSKVP